MRTGQTAAALILACLVTLLGSVEARKPYPELGTVACANKIDDDLDGLVDAADADCAVANAFTAITGGFAAEAEDLLRTGPWTSVVDASASGGDYATVPLGGHAFGGQLAGKGVTAGDYHLWLRVQIPANPVSGITWASVSATPIVQPNNAVAALLNNGEATEGWSWVAVGAFGSLEAYGAQTMETAQQTFTAVTNDILYLMGLPDLRIDCVALITVGSPESPQCPTGGAGPPPTAHYAIKHTPTAPAIGDAVWNSANVLTWAGYNSTTTPTPVTQLLRHGNDLYLRHAVTDGNLWALTCGNDQGCVATGDNVFINMRDVVSPAAKDGTTIKVGCDLRAQLYSQNWGGASGAADLTYSAGEVCTLTLNGTLDALATPDGDTAYVIQLKLTPGWSLTNGAQFSADLRTYQRDGIDPGLVGHRQAKNPTSGAFDDQTAWAVFEYVDESVTGGSTPDTTAPTVTALNCNINVTTSGFTCTWATTEEGTCRLQWDTDNDGAVSGADLAPSTGPKNCGASSGDACTCTQTGFTAGLALELQASVTDAAGNTGQSSVVDQSTAATSGANTFYASLSVTGTGGAGTSVSPWGLTHALLQMDPGETLLIKDGTHTSTASLPGLWIKCAGGSHKNGSAAAPITVRAENPRAAKIKGTVAGGMPVGIQGCSYWVIEDLTLEHTYAPTGEKIGITGSTNYAVHVSDSPNITLRGNLIYNTDGNTGDAEHPEVAVAVHSSNGFLLEENEAYGGANHLFSLKWNKSGTFRGNYGHGGCYAAGAGSGVAIYPTAGVVFENNIMDTDTCGSLYWKHGFYVASYDLNTPTKFPSNGNRFYANIVVGTNNCYDQDYKEDAGEAGWIKSSTMQDFLCLRSVSGLEFKNHLTTGNVVRRISMLHGGIGFYAYKLGISPTGPNYTLHADDLLAVSNSGTGIRFQNMVTWSIDGAISSQNNVDFNAQSSGTCANCTNTSTTNPNIGTKTVYITVGGVPKGAQVHKRYLNGTVTGNNMFVTSAPSGYGSSHNYYFYGCGPVVSGTPNNTANRRCADVANRLGVTTANMSGAPGY